jgi:diguanylate cyclase (GGDEF)-like protein
VRNDGEMTERHDPYRVLFRDPQLRAALSRIGVFASNYRTGENLPSTMWIEHGRSTDDTGEDLAWTDRIHPDDRARVAAAVQEVLRGESAAFDEVFRFALPDGTYRWVVTRGTVVDSNPDGTAAVFVGLDIDIEAFKSVESRLEHQKNQLETLHEIVAVIGASLDLRETVHRVLAETKRILPYDTATVQVLNGGTLQVIGSYGFENPAAVAEMTFAHPSPGSLSTQALESRVPCITGNVSRDFPAFQQPTPERPVISWLGIPLVRGDVVFGLMALDSYHPDTYTAEHQRVAATIGAHIAVARENARLHEETYQMAMADALTGAGSRRRFQVEGRLLFETAQRASDSVCVLLLDIDHFKMVNDRWGHEVGDRVLQRVAATCRDELRGTDLFARYGGEEFVVVVPGARDGEGMMLAERIRAAVGNVTHPELDGGVTVSIGVASDVPARGATLDALVARADGALYTAKADGRNRVAVAPAATSA